MLRGVQVVVSGLALAVMLAAANVATLQLARSAVRGAELSVRRAVGATTARQAQHLLVESLVLTGIGGAAGTIASYWASAAIGSLGVRVLPRMDLVGLDLRTIGVAALPFHGAVEIEAWAFKPAATGK